MVTEDIFENTLVISWLGEREARLARGWANETAADGVYTPL